MKIDTGINEEHRKQICQGLSALLANTYLLYLKTQNFHWNVTGIHFTSLHELFEKQYQDLADGIDDIAERIRALGYPTPASFAQFSQLATVNEETSVPVANVMIQQLLADHETVIKQARALLEEVSAASDDVTDDLLADRLAAHEKFAWMLRSILS